jgi:transglutaminase-like putative cysteine protease
MLDAVFLKLAPFARRTPPRLVLLAVVAFAAAPFAVDHVCRSWLGDGYPLEIQMVLALRNLGLGLAACAAWRVCLRLAGGVSLFLMLFAVSLADSRAVVVLLGLYSAAGGAWLMIVYWAELRHPATTRAVVLERRPGRVGVPWVAVLCALGAAGAVLALFVTGPRWGPRVLGEWLATSGGTGDYDPFARGGVNDGDEEVNGANARTTGMVESDSFLDSPLPSLYDLVHDLYGDPFKPKSVERAQALDSKTRARELEKRPAENLRPGREFATARRSPERPRDPADRAARALFEVRGRTPLHVRATAFDEFDGDAWHEVTFDRSSCLLDREPDGCWMRVRERQPPDVFAETEEHHLTIAGPLGSLLPAPPHLVRFRVGLVDDATFFAWGRERVLRMASRNTPAGFTVHTESRVVDRRRLSAVRFLSGPSGGDAVPVSLPDDLDPDVRALAREWTRGRPRGWAQIEAVVGRLRAEYALDWAASAPEGCTEPLRHFLLESRRGPDYQFASAAAILLRLLNYRTRLVSGFYAAPERYDPETDHTPVGPDDLHFWAEVMLPSGDWLVLEPTPGYEVLGPAPGWAERAWAALVAVGGWVGRHPVLVTVSLLALAVVWWRRLALLDAAALALWAAFPGRCWRRCLGRARRLLERRGRWAGRPRPACQTFAAWLHAARPGAGPLADDLGLLAHMAEWAAYAPDGEPPWGMDDVRRVCRRALTGWTLKRWRAAVGPSRGGA